MSVPVIKTSLVSGEVSPAMFGHVDLARMQSAASTMRNGWPSFHGGYYSRAGTAFVGFSKQTGRSVPPKLISFQFSINQGLALEFGNFYMRVIKNGAFVSDAQALITALTNTNPATISFNGTGYDAASAVPVDTGVTSSYAPGENVTLIGPATTPTVLNVTNTKLVNLGVAAPGGGYVPTNTINLTGGTQSTAAVLTVSTTTVVAATVANAGSGAPATFTVTGTTGTGAKFQASLTRYPHNIGVNSIVFGGAYTANPANLSAEPVTASGQTGITLNITMGVGAIALTNPGVFTANAAGGTFTQASTSGSGAGATFAGALFGPNAVTVATAGVYASYPANPVPQASTSGSGSGAAFTVTTGTITLSPFNNGDWLNLSGIGGVTQANGNTFVAQNVTSGSAQLYDVYGNAVDATGWGTYTSGGVASRIYTLPTIYSENDLAWLKTIESADVMSICCVNQQTLVEYPPQDLSRAADASWSFAPVIPAPSATPPATISGSSSSSGSVDYAYVVTSVADDGTESIASAILNVNSAVDIAATAGSITVTWGAVAGISEYNVYKAQPSYGAPVPAGALFGYAGSAFGTQLVDGPSAIVPDLTQVPPTHQNPFARGQIAAAKVLTSSGTVTTVTVAINTSTGSGGVIVPVVISSELVALIVEEPGQNYAPTDTLSLTVTGGGSATGSITVGAQSGTYPGTVAYFQERRAYACSINNTDTYWMSQPGSFTNFDSRSPPIDSDAVTGSPWSVQVNGVQWMIQTAGGLLVFTGLQAWLLVGAGSFATNAAAISPTSQDANPQPEVGCSPTLRPIKVNYDVIFSDSNSQFYYDQPYQLYALSEPIDLTQLSTHLFSGYTFVSHAWCRNPNKLMWAIRDDGIMISLTFLKAEQVQGWARHDTQGLFVSNCEVIEPPVDAQYLAVQRFPSTYGAGQNTYTIERMDNRSPQQWSVAESVWAVDCGLQLGQPQPAASLTASSATGAGKCSGVTNLVGGTGYSAATTATVVDNDGEGPGTGAVPALTIAGGVITAVSFAGNQGVNYVSPQLVFTDPAGSAGGAGASATITLDNSATFTASAAVFSNANVGSVVRVGGGIAAITAYTDSQHVTANLLVPITQTIPGSTSPLTAPAGSWTMTAPVTSVGGLRHLAGLQVTGLADGNVVPLTTVDQFGNVALPKAASAVTLGLGFQCQLQGVYLLEPNVQGARKKISDVTVRIENSRGLKIGTNQPDGSTLSPPQLAPAWYGLTAVPDKAVPAYNALCTPLYTGDVRQSVSGGFQTPGQVAIQQDNPLPMNILALVSEVLTGDTPQQQWPKKQQGQGQ